MAVVETERGDGIMVVRMNRPERLNALGRELRVGLAEAWAEFRDSRDLEVAIYTGTGRAFCAGEDMKETIERGAPAAGGGVVRPEDPYMAGTIDKPVIAAINGYAMGGG
jgi:enoyl-CoA hydratase/carnithine racemase